MPPASRSRTSSRRSPLRRLAAVTTAFGFAGFGPGSPYGSADERALRLQFRDGFLILKSRDPEGTVEHEVTSIERTRVSDAQFAPPASYTELQRPGLPPRP